MAPRNRIESAYGSKESVEDDEGFRELRRGVVHPVLEAEMDVDSGLDNGSGPREDCRIGLGTTGGR